MSDPETLPEFRRPLPHGIFCAPVQGPHSEAIDTTRLAAAATARPLRDKSSGRWQTWQSIWRQMVFLPARARSR
jgi:hypothetical protein